jgi:hypothetical protein
MAQVQEAAGIMSLLSDRITLPASTAELAIQYQQGKPFPHLVLDNIFPQAMLDDLVGEIPSKDDKKWVNESHDRMTKSNLRSAVELGEVGYQFTSFLNSAKFLYLVSELTGIQSLLPDPYMGGAGYHVVPSGGKFDVHADRNIDQVTGLRRRLAMLVYLNKNWEHEFGGQLELWDKTAMKCEKSVEPIFNRTVIFEVTDENFHGVRPVLNQERARVSFACYYHTVPDANFIPHASIYSPSFYLKKDPLLKRMAADFLPPVVYRAAKKVTGR